MSFGLNVDLTATGFARITSQVDKTVADFGRLSKQTSLISTAMNSAFAALGVGLSVAGFTEMIKSSIELGDTLKDLSKSTGISVENLSGLQVAAKQSGSDLDSIATSINKLSVNMGKDGEAFKQLGIDAKDPLEAFAQLSDVFNSIQDPQQRAAFGATALGKAWAGTAPLLAEGGDSIRKMVSEGRIAANITTEMAINADIFNDNMTIMSTRMAGLAAGVTSKLLPSFVATIEYLQVLSSQAADTGNNIISMANIFNFAAKGMAGSQFFIDGLGKSIGSLAAKSVALAHLDFKGISVIDEAFNADIAKASNNLTDFVNKLDAPIKANVEVEVKTPKKAVSDDKLNAFIGAGGAADTAAKKAEDSAKRMTDATAGIIANLQKEVALRGDNSALASITYDIEFGGLQNISVLQKSKLLSLSKEKDAISENAKAYQEYDDIIEQGIQLAKKQREETAATQDRLDLKFNAPSRTLNAGIADVADAQSLGIINTEQAKKAYDDLGRAFNDSFTDPAKGNVDSLSTYAEQAARNIQTSFADFLFDPFAKGTESMASSFLKTIKRMAADAASAQLMEALFGKVSSKGGDSSGLFGTLIKAVVGGVAGAYGGGGGFNGTGPLLSFQNANGNAFSHGSVIPFATGGIFNSPQTFPMSGGNIGLLGEAGPEAIMPLTRGANGKLGIMAQGGGSGDTINNVTIQVQSKQGESSSETGQKVGEAFIRAIAKEEIKTAARPGNTLNQTTKFG